MGGSYAVVCDLAYPSQDFIELRMLILLINRSAVDGEIPGGNWGTFRADWAEANPRTRDRPQTS